MKRYKNVSGSLLAIDCTTYTRYLEPSEIATLPNSRDVRYHTRSGKLMSVRNGKSKRKSKSKRKYSKKVYSTKTVKKKKSKTDNKTETN